MNKNIFLFGFFFCFFGISSKYKEPMVSVNKKENIKKIFIKDRSDSDEKTISTSFGKVKTNVSQTKVQNNPVFVNFLSKFNKKKCVLKYFKDQFLGYCTNDSLFIFDVDSHRTISLSLKLNRTDRIQCFSFDSKFIFVKLRHSIKIFTIEGKEIATYKFINKEVSGMDIFVDQNTFYLVTHNKDILGFSFLNRDIKLIFFNNDFHSSNNTHKFNFIVDNYIYILVNKRFSIVHKKSGAILKNTYLKSYYNDLLISNNFAIVTAKSRFCKISLDDFSATYNDEIQLFGKILILKDNASISYNNSIYNGDYIFTFFFSNCFFRYAENTYDSHCFLIKNSVVSEFILEGFIITNVFHMGSDILLVDTKSKSLVFI